MWADSEGPTTATLVFRVGWADEPLARRGLTHLVEHLALAGVAADRPYACNGHTAQNLTRFAMTGTPEQATDFLQRVTGALSNLPLDRLDHELQVLRAEEHARPAGVSAVLLARRFGATGYGTAAYPQLGLNRVDPEVVAGWRDRWFTAGNAVLWISTPPSQSLRFDLPRGSLQPFPEARPLPMAFPAIAHASTAALAIGMVGERAHETVLSAAILDRRLQLTLGHQLGLSYAAGASYERLDRALAHVLLTADYVPGRAVDAAQAMAAVLREVAERGPADDELASAQATIRSAPSPLDGRRALLAELDRASEDRLAGLDALGGDDHAQLLAAITSQQVTSSVDRLAWSAIMLAPPGVSPSAIHFHAYPDWSTDMVAGRTIGRRIVATGGAAPGARLIVGDEGISLVDSLGRAATVRFSRCAAALWWADGRRQLIGEDGVGLTVLPQEWEFADQLVRTIQEGIPADLWVPMSPLGKEGELTCEVCGRAPATSLRLRCVTGLVVLFSVRTENHIVCRDCGIARFRQVGAESMVTGWWGLVAYFANLVVLAGNYLQRRRLNALGRPYGDPARPPLRAGRRLWARPATLVTAAVLGLPLALIAAAIAGTVTGR